MRSVILIAVLTFLNLACASTRIYDTKTKSDLTLDQLAQNMPESGTVVLAEFHYHKATGQAQGDIIRAVVANKQKENNFYVAWEFLDYPEQSNVTSAFNAWRLGRSDDLRFLGQLFPASRDVAQNETYLPFFRAARDLGGSIVATNAPRNWKRIITTQGIENLDPDKVPPNYELGSAHYRERFVAAMGGHTPADKIKLYFQAQCYTDAVMAWSIVQNAGHDFGFLVVGAFHSDYKDGVSTSLAKIDNRNVVSIKIVDASELSDTEYQELLQGHDKYGAIADYLYLLNAPNPAN